MPTQEEVNAFLKKKNTTLKEKLLAQQRDADYKNHLHLIGVDYLELPGGDING